MSARPRVLLGSIATILLVVLAVGCDKEDKIVVENFPPSQENRPPLIVTYSPTFPSGGIEITTLSPRGVDLQVLVGDPDGLDDISAVTLDIDSVIVKRIILRPDTSSSGCLRFSYFPTDTVETQLILPLPTTFPGIKLKQLAKSSSGLYVASTFGGSGFGFPYILDEATNLVNLGGYCGSGSVGFGGPWMALPPAVPTETEVVLTYLDAEYIGGRVTVWDKVGANAVLQLPNLEIVYTTLEEKNAAP